MFTGIINDVGEVRAIRRNGDTCFEFTTHYDTDGIDIGASICCSGVCMTVIEKGKDWFSVSASGETMSKTTLTNWKKGTAVNFERALKAGDELGGHIVSGHVDGTARIKSISREGDSLKFIFESPDSLSRFIAAKGSVSLDGVSLTVNDVEANCFSVNIIPHTAKSTTFGTLSENNSVNMEIDMLARYVARLLEKE